MPLKARSPKRGLILALVIGAFALWKSAERQGLGPLEGTCGQEAASCSLPQEATIPIALMNIHRGVGLDGKDDLQRTAECLKGGQLVALNEVGGKGDAETLASILELVPLFAATEKFLWREDFGNALLSLAPPQSFERVPLPFEGEGGWRNLLIARWPWQGKELTVLITHLDRGSAREGQLALVIERFRKEPAPKVLLGDLNSGRKDPLLAPLLADLSLSVADPGEENRIDWIIGQGVTFTTVQVCDVGASDHPALLTDMTISP